MVKSTVSAEPNIYKMIPDLARCDDGTMVCAYRESLIHGRWPWNRVAMNISKDGGYNWRPKKIIADIPDQNTGGGWNTPRLLSLGGRNLLMVCDWCPPNEQEYTPRGKLFSWHSTDAGDTWSDPVETPIKARICPSLFRSRSGKIFLGIDGWDGTTWCVDLWTSEDNGVSWQGPTTISDSTTLHLNESTFCQLDDGTIICYIREDVEQQCAWKAISTDDGATWNGPFRTDMLACIGRPQAGVLRSGEVVIFYGFGTAPRLLLLHAEDQKRAADPDCTKNANKGHLSPDFRRFFVDHDRSVHPDGAYSGWVQLPNGEIYLVQYIVDDAPMAFIRSYRISRSDWILSPEPGIAQIEHGRYKEALYHEQTLDATEKLYQSNNSRHE